MKAVKDFFDDLRVQLLIISVHEINNVSLIESIEIDVSIVDYKSASNWE